MTEDTEEIAAEEQDNKTEQNSVEPVVEKEVLESSGGNGVQQEADELAAQVNTSSTGTDWSLSDDGGLTITSDAGMADWITQAADSKAQVKTVTIQNDVTNIGKNAFKSCTNLTGITIPESVTKIGDYAFQGCTGLTSITIPDSVTEIGMCAFDGCSGLTSITISKSLKTIGYAVFRGCTGLKSITIPESVTIIGGTAFSDCNSLESVSIQGNLTSIQGSVFKNCTSLKSITIPESVTSIGAYAFQNCASLTSIEIPNKVEGISYYTFDGCTNLASITLPESGTYIGTYAFSGCSSLTSIEIPNKVTTIGSNAFENCTALTSVTMLPDTPPTLDKEVFLGCKFVTDSIKGISVPLGKAGSYQEKWSDWADYIVAVLEITTQPTAQSVQNGEAVTFSVAAEGDAPITYQWQVDKNDGNGFVNITNETSLTYAISAVDMSYNGYRYRCAVTDKNGTSIISDEVLLTVTVSDAEKIANAKPVAQAALDQFTAYNSTTANSFQWTIREALSAAGIKDVGNKAVITKIEATTKAEGSITGTLTLTCGDAMDTLEINKTIAMLISKVAAAKQVVNNTIDGLTVTNETTHDSIQKEIDAALTKEGITGVTATVQPIAKEEATVHDKGFISFNVVIECETEDTVTIGPEILWIEVPDTDKVAAAQKVVNDTINGFTATNDTTKEDIQTAINDALKKEKLPGVTVTVGEISKTAATTEAAGSISGTITIICGTETDTVALEKTIAQLSALGAAKAVVEEALEGFTATNDTTKEDIQAAIDAALSKAGITSATAAVGNIIKREATTANTGSIDGTITIQCGTETDKVVLRKTIAKVLVSDADKVKAAKEVVENALKELKVTNDTTKADIQTAIDASFSTEGITDATATVGDISKTAATTEVLGSINGVITITCGTETGTVALEKLIAKLPALETAKAVVEKTLEELIVTNDTTKQDIYTAISKAIIEAGITHITIIVGDISKTEATIDTEGSISGKVTIKHELYGTETDTVNVSKTIAKLSVSEAAKAVVEKTLEELIVTNDTTQQDIQAAIDAALSKAGITDVAVTMGDISKTEATTDTEGNISGKVTIKCGTETDTVDVSKTIAKLPETTDDKDTEKAKKIIEDALKGITITNDTTKADLLETLKKAFGDGGTVESVEVTKKTSATQDTAGSLDLEIKVLINEKIITINTTAPIQKLSSKTGMCVSFTDYYKVGDDSKPCYKYTGTAVKPAVEVYHNEKLLTVGNDYTISYKNNTKVGSMASLIVKGKGNYSGSSNVVNFTIINADINNDTDHPTEMTVVAGTKVDPVIMNGTKRLTAKDYELTGDGLDKGKYATATAAGVFNTLTVTGIGSYEGSSFTIQVKVIDKNAAKKLAVTVDKGFKPVYDGNAFNFNTLLKSSNNPNGMITVTDSKEKTKVLEQGQHFTVVCASNLTNAGTVKFTLTGMGEYAGSISKTFIISPLKVIDSNKFSVTFDAEKIYEYKASGTIVDNLVVKYLGETDLDTDDQILRRGIDYKVSYSNNKKVSNSKDAQLKITFLGNYKGSAPVLKDFKVKAAKMSAENTLVTVPDMVYSKADKAYKSKPIVTVDGAAIKASDYDVSYKWATESKAEKDAEYASDDKVKITIAEGDHYAKVKVTITPRGSYVLAEGAVIEGCYYVRKADGAVDLSKAKVTFHDKAGNQLKNLEYNGAAFYTPEGNNPNAENAADDANAVYVRVTVKNQKIDPELYDVIWTNATAKGKATVVIRGKGITTQKGIAVGSNNQAISINAMVLKGRNLKTFMEKSAKNLKKMFL